MMQKIAIIAAVGLPFWNIPLGARVIKRRSSEDISIYWGVGVWTCLALMAPSGFTSIDPVWRAFNVVNFFLFSIVVVIVVLYKKKKTGTQ